MKEATKLKLAEAYKNAVREQVAKGGHSRWGGGDSVAVIEAVVTAASDDPEAQAEGFDAIREYVSNVVNPSAFAQVLEGLPTEHPAHIRRPEKGTRSKVKGAGL